MGFNESLDLKVLDDVFKRHGIKCYFKPPRFFFCLVVLKSSSACIKTSKFWTKGVGKGLKLGENVVKIIKNFKIC